MRIDTDIVPATIEEAVEVVLKNLEPDDIVFIKEHGSSGLHFGVGMHMRNHWSFWEDTPLRRDAAVRYKIAHADDLSELLWDWVGARVQGEAFDPLKTCGRIHRHWKQYKVTSLQAGGVDEKGAQLSKEELRKLNR